MDFVLVIFLNTRYVDEVVLFIVSPASRIVDVLGVPLKIAYSVFVVLMCRSYSRAHISTFWHSSCRLCLDFASSTRSSAYKRQLILGSPCILRPVPC